MCVAGRWSNRRAGAPVDLQKQADPNQNPAGFLGTYDVLKWR